MTLLCPCGHSIKIATETGDHEMEIIPRAAINDFCERIFLATQGVIEKELFRRRIVGVLIAQREPGLVGYECLACGRLAIARDGEIGLWFRRDLDSPHSVDSVMQLVTRP